MITKVKQFSIFDNPTLLEAIGPNSNAQHIIETKKSKIKNNMKLNQNNSELTQLNLFDTITTITSSNISIGLNKTILTKTVQNKSNELTSNYNIPMNSSVTYNPKQKCTNNLAAIETLKFIENQNRIATDEEKSKLVKYVGWGGLAQKVFCDSPTKEWKDLSLKVKEIMTEEEYADAKKSSLTAFFTPFNIISFIYNSLEKLGFSGGKVLEPSCGIGHFIGMAPANLSSNLSFTGIELDSLSTRIAKVLYPKSKIYCTGFEKIDLESNFDLAIGNIPFGNYSVVDKKYNKHNFKIHNYFFAKSLEILKENGILAFITSRYTMDSVNDSVRKYISKKAKLLFAVRLPNNSFSDTETITDIIFLQKKSSQENSTSENLEWLSIGNDKNGIKLNQYFINHPNMVMGSVCLSKHTNQYGQYELIIDGSELDLNKKLSEILKNDIPNNVCKENYILPKKASNFIDLFDEHKVPETLDANDYPMVKQYAYINIDDRIYQKIDYKLILQKLNNNKNQRIKGLLNIKNILDKIFKVQLSTSDDIELLLYQKELNSIYDNFVFSYGYINNKQNKAAFGEDPCYFLLCSLESLNRDGVTFSKADIFSKRTISYQKKIEHVDSIDEAYSISMASTLKVDFQLMSKLTDKSVGEIKTYLLEKQLIFKNPETELFEMADEYLSGKVVDKFTFAKTSSKVNSEEDYKYNIEALIKVQPIPIDATNINVKLGSIWVPDKYIKQFIVELLDINEENTEKLSVSFIKFNATYIVEGTNKIYIDNYLNNTKWGTLKISAIKLIILCLNMKEANVYDRVYDSVKGKDVSILNKKETLIARQKQLEIKAEFQNWIWQDFNRREHLVSIYNSIFNNTRLRAYDGSKIKLHGISMQAPKLRDYQLNAVARAIYDGNTLLAHCCGAGKTFEMVAAGMEMKYLGLCTKAMYVVPNHLVESGQFAREFLQLYPLANILVATSKDFSAANRKKFVSKIATGNYDAIIIGHSSFTLIPVCPETEEKFIKEQITEIEIAINSIDADFKKTVKQLEKIKLQLESRLTKLLNMPKDNVITFENLGVDQIFVDEAHGYKNLFIYSKLRGVPGVPSSFAQKTEDMFMKIQYLIEKNKVNGYKRRGVVFATGTPVTNTMAEIYVLMKFLMSDRLKEIGFDSFDAWASVFGEIVSSVEINPTGTGYRSKMRFAKFHNIPELMSLFKEIADIITPEMVNLPIPKLEDGKFKIVQTPINEEIKEYVDSLVKRAENIHKGLIDSTEDNMLCVVNDGKKAALDPRLVDIDINYSNSKVNTCISNVFNEWRNGISDKLTQVIFCDLGTPKSNSVNKTMEELLDNCNFNIYDYIKGKLISLGVPKAEIAFIHDANTSAKKTALFNKFNAGEIRILLGSTSKMGEGCNIQKRLVAMHELDCPWRPSDLQQREGRILRVGSLLYSQDKTVRIYRYCTKGTFDNYSWQTVETKAKFIAQIMNGSSNARSMEDIDEKVMSYAEMKAACSDNPLIAEKIKLDIEVQRLQTLEAGFKREQYNAESSLESNKKRILNLSNVLEKLKQDLVIRNNNSNTDDPFKMTIGNKIYAPYVNKDGNSVTGKSDAGEYILTKFQNINLNEKIFLTKYKGFNLYLAKEKDNYSMLSNYILIEGYSTFNIDCSNYSDGYYVVQKIDSFINSLDKEIANTIESINHLKQENKGYSSEANKTFEFADKLKNLLKRQSDINLQLNLSFSELAS